MSEQHGGAQTAKPKAVPLNAATQAVPFPAGVYRFSVRTASPVIEGTAATPFPALLVAAAPGTQPGAVEFVGNPSTVCAWLCNVGDVVVTKVGAQGATLILSSMRTASDTQAFDIKVEQIDVPATQKVPAASKEPSLKLRLAVHIRGQGDVQFADSEWAGRVGGGTWIEALSILPEEGLGGSDIECKGLAANGFETPWLSEGAFCGTKGAGVPLVGFAVRLKPSAAARYDVEYSAYFRSGVTVGPLRNGVPCRSKSAGDPLEAVQIRVVKRAAPAVLPSAEAKAGKAPAKSDGKKGPSFSKFREEGAPVAKAADKKPTTKAIPGQAVAPSKAAPSKATSKASPKTAPPAASKSKAIKTSGKRK